MKPTQKISLEKIFTYFLLTPFKSHLKLNLIMKSLIENPLQNSLKNVITNLITKKNFTKKISPILPINTTQVLKSPLNCQSI